MRQTAYDVLRAVDQRDAYVNLLLPALLRDAALSGRDAAFATELVHGAIRLQGTYDVIIDELVTRRMQPGVRDALRLGCHQLLSMRVPGHAAVSTSVDLVRRNTGEPPARMVNAVLRRVSGRSLAEWVELLAPSRDEDRAGHLAIAYSHPRWIVAALADAVAHDRASQRVWDEVEALLAADNHPARVTLAAIPGRASVAELVEAGAAPGKWSEHAATLGSGDPAAVPAVREGRARVQDEGSQLVARAVADAELDGPDRWWLDMCAGPGGKAALLAGLADRRGARLLAADRQGSRARLVKGALSEAPAGRAEIAHQTGVAGVVVADGTTPPWASAAFDRVLVDAPCSGLGALRRRPEARWRRTPEDVTALVRLQRALLHAALDSCREGGVVGYVTCTPHVSETREVVDGVLEARSDALEEDARPLLSLVPDTGHGPHVQLWPHRHGTDAMFLALLRRTGR
ncbi:MAG: rRNA cytosine-C5-methyltransferase [Propionibacteriales bacterium]|nr:rRNA cytosine-C5-methyltransferase [Propionibacteriales bacterium]